jgi:molybdate transport system substrate-binding protein
MSRRSLIALVLGLLLHLTATAADEVVVMTSGAFTAAYLELVPGFERSSSHTVKTATTTMGVGAESIPNRLRRHETADVVIVAADALDQMMKDGLIIAGSRVDLARSSIGVAVRAGTRVPDIGSVEALTRTLKAARSVAYSASVSGDYLSMELFPRLGLAEEMNRKGQRIERERVVAVVARGDADLGFQQISELLPVPGIVIVGPLPAAAQRVTIFAAGVAAGTRNVAGARAFIQYLASPNASGVVTASGMELITR